MSVIVFIPVRGGSKGIPGKNIRPFCGRPLVYWTVRAAQEAVAVDRVVVSTDSDRIAETVSGFGLDKVSVFRRSEQTATDTASTESAMLEYLQAAGPDPDDLFILVQATSPMLEGAQLDQAIAEYREGRYDSMLSCVRNKRFFWSDEGKPLNYDYMHRPRRQEFAGMWMENGAFYISKATAVLKNGNRLSGKIGVFEMPEYTSFEIDEPEDWIIMENLMRRHVLKPAARPDVRLFVSDVDGVLTDGGMYYSEKGDESKKFNTRDGMGFQLIREAGIKTGIITSESTEMVTRRAKKLKIDYLQQAKRDGGKLSALQEMCGEMGISLDQVAYIGDDINCLAVLQAVGYKACPADAAAAVKAVPGIRIMQHKGGEGCVREWAEFILNIG